MSSSPLPNGTTLRSPAPSSAPASSQNPTSSLLSDQIQQRQAEKDLPGGWIVQKFGGTSIGKFPDKIARDIVAAALSDHRIAVVCSARSSNTKNEGTTNRLLRAAREAENPNTSSYQPLVEAIRNDHIAAARSYIRSPHLMSTLTRSIDSECDSLTKILESAQHLEEVTSRSEDKIVSKGEKLSCLFMTALLRDVGVNAKYVDLSDVVRTPSGIVTPVTGGAGLAGQAVEGDSAHRLDEEFYGRVAEALGDVVMSAVTPLDTDGAGDSGDGAGVTGPVVPVLTGYFGTIPGGLLASIGRGYTDLCAALVAVGLQSKYNKVHVPHSSHDMDLPHAPLPISTSQPSPPSNQHPRTFRHISDRLTSPVDELHIWKEVDGIFTADPRRVPTARLLPSVTPHEAAELTFYGSEVIHPFTMEQVMRLRIPIHIKNVTNPKGAGTIVIPNEEEEEEDEEIDEVGPRDDSNKSLDGAISRARSRTLSSRPKRPTAVTVKRNITVLNVHSNKRTRAHGFLMNIFRVLDKYRLSVDLISSSEVHVSLALHSETASLDPTPTQNTSSTHAAKPSSTTTTPAAAAEASPIPSEALFALSSFGTVHVRPHMAIISLVGSSLKNMVGASGMFFSILGKHGINIEMISQGASEINISCVVEGRQAERALGVVHTEVFVFGGE